MGQPFYITTAISYPNGKPHIGHAYEAIAADAIARFNRQSGREVRFQTGTDEHGLKMVQTARERGVEVGGLDGHHDFLVGQVDVVVDQTEVADVGGLLGDVADESGVAGFVDRRQHTRVAHVVAVFHGGLRQCAQMRQQKFLGGNRIQR